MHLKQRELEFDKVYDGDIFGFAADNILDDIIGAATDHECHHVGYSAWIKGSLYLIEATDKGVRKILMSDFLKEYKKKYGSSAKMWHFSLKSELRKVFNAERFKKFTEKAVGKEYDWIQAALSAIDKLDKLGITKNKECDKYFFCSELCCRMLEESTKAFNINCSEQTPADVCMMKIYSTYYSSQIMGKSTYLRKFNYIEINQK